MNLEEEIKKAGLTVETYENCMQDIQDKLNGIQDLEWEEIRAKYNLTIPSNSLRKAAGPKLFGGAFAAEYFATQQMRKKPMDALDLKLEQLRKEKIKLQTLNVERNRIDRAEARQELFYESVGKVCASLPLPDFKPLMPEDVEGREYILELADIHYGADFVAQHNIYNREEAQHRLELALGHTIDFVIQHRLNKLHVVCLGDSVQNILRVSDLRLNDTDVIKCVVEISRLLAQFINQLSQYVKVEYYHVPTANHGQIRPLASKANELPGEDYEYIIGNYIKDLVRDNERITVNLAREGEQFVEVNLRAYNVYAMHGHQFRSTGTAMPNFSMWLQRDVDILLLGHFHASNDITVGDGCTSDCEILVAPSLCGADPYADRLFKGAKAACKIYGFSDIYGHTETYKFILN